MHPNDSGNGLEIPAALPAWGDSRARQGHADEAYSVTEVAFATKTQKDEDAEVAIAEAARRRQL